MCLFSCLSLCICVSKPACNHPQKMKIIGTAEKLVILAV